MIRQSNDRTYCAVVEYVEDLSGRINNMYGIQPEIFLRFNQDTEVTGAAILAYCTPDMYIELNIPYNYTFGKIHKAMLTCVLVHEYCHYIEALSMSGKNRVNTSVIYENDQKYRRAEEQRNWTATKQLAKKLGLWNKPFYAAVRDCYYTTSLQF
ncbi:hypothetical protein KA005_76260 [bacterium]|nr:hypothetical protein [bacterium]